MGDVDEVVGMIRGAWVTLCLRATCELGLVDALDEPRDATTLSELTSTDPSTLARLLRVLVDQGLLEVDDGRYLPTARGEVLRLDHPSGVRNLALMQTELPNLSAWQHLADAVRRGSSVFEDLIGQTSWDWLAEHPEEEAIFNAAMARRGSLQVEAVLAACDLSADLLVVDVGGGTGGMLAELLDRQPALSGIVADRPDVARAATIALAAAGLGDRAQGVPSDFFVSVPTGGDVYVLANVLHDWDDAEAVTILRTLHEAMAPQATLLLVENVLDAPGRSAVHQKDLHLLDLHMLVMFGARERTQSEYDDLLVAAGFTPSTTSTSPNTWNVLRSRPSD